MRILVVDDDPDHQVLIRHHLSACGWDVVLASTGHDALAMLEGVDLVLLDYHLPDIAGLEAIQRIREADGPGVIVVTGRSHEQAVLEAMRAGAMDYIVKDASFLDALPHHVERARRHRDLARRASELQRLALLMVTTSGRDEVLAAIVDGTRTVMCADACSLHLEENGRLVLARASGDPLLAAFAGGVDEETILDACAEGIAVFPKRLYVPVKAPTGETLGVLGVANRVPVSYSADEIELAGAFAAFVGISLLNLRRLELEQRLVVELQTNLDAKRRFVDHLSHELRTPLTCVRGFASLLEERWAELDTAQRQEFVTKIDAHAKALDDMLGHLLDFATINSGSDLTAWRAQHECTPATGASA